MGYLELEPFEAMTRSPLTRRSLLGAAAATLGSLLTTGCETRGSSATKADLLSSAMPNADLPMPTVFLPHGGGPWPFMKDGALGEAGAWSRMRLYMEALGQVPPRKPRAVLLVSAHWEANVATLQTAAQPPMLYDYYGFPEETYSIEWPAPGAPEVATEVRSLLEKAGFRTAEDLDRGFDHGAFVPLKLAYPRADVPTLQLSLKAGLDPREHLRIGRALAPLRREGVFIVGSGMSYHNMRQLMTAARGGKGTIREESRAFDDWLAELAELDGDGRESRLAEWERAPAARACHPREEHLLPLMVVAGAAPESRASLPYRDQVMGAHVSAVHFS